MSLLSRFSPAILLSFGAVRSCHPHVFGQSLLLHVSAASKTGNTRDMSGYSVEQRGGVYKADYRLFVKDAQGNVVSPFHDIPLFHDEANSIFNMVVEVPRWTNAKMEINLKEKFNPIKQDIKKGKLRFVANCFPHKGYIWNYGALPQTWEDPSHTDASTQCKGDGDPVDVCEIGQKIHESGAVVPVKLLGTLAMIDEGETDWKVLAIDVTDPLADKLNDVDDIEREMPGFLAATVEWFKIYKMPDGKPANEFAFDAKPKDRAFATNIVKELNGQWKKMIEGDKDPEGVSRACTVLSAASKVPASDAAAAVEAEAPKSEAEAVPEAVAKWFYVSA